MNLLIIQNYIRQPYVFRWHMKCVHTAVVVWIPFELVVIPLLDRKKMFLVSSGWGKFELLLMKCSVSHEVYNNAIFVTKQ